MSTKAKTKKTDPTKDIFNRPAQTFHMMGKEYKYEFIPSGHFQDILLDLLAAVINLDAVVSKALDAVKNEMLEPSEKEKQEKEDASFNAEVMAVAGRLLKDKLFEIISDVLQYQNDESYFSPTLLSKKTRPLEVAQFMRLVMEDPEILTAIQEYTSGLGKLKGLIPTAEAKAEP